MDELKRAWHAGDSYWGGNRDINSSSIGIELDNNGREPFADAQIDALAGSARGSEDALEYSGGERAGAW